ncbi:7485_t:CDS:2, partial [Cetraspora pellucida]
EALLIIKPIPSPHTAENIKSSLDQIITEWGLTGRVFCITTDNGTNIKKSIRLMNNIRRSACSAHTLHPKQTERLNDAQEKCRYATIYQVIEDVSTRWNSSYLAWIRLKELRKVINYLVLMLPSELEQRDQLDDEYLKLVNLTENEWQLLDSLILLLKPFYDATTIFSGSNYPTFNLIYPTMKLLIKKFAPSDSQTEDNYADLLFGPREQISDQSQFIADTEDSSESDIEYEYEAPSILEQLRKPLHASQGRKKKIIEKLKKIYLNSVMIQDLKIDEKIDNAKYLKVDNLQ